MSVRNKGYFIASIILNVISLIVVFVGLVAEDVWISIISTVFLIAGLLMIMHWSTISYKWVCDKCGEVFEITFWQNVLGINGGINYKKLYCPKCQKKNFCKGVPK